MKRRVAFKKPGVLAIEPKAFGVEMSIEPVTTEPFREENGVAIVTICGPLSHHDDGWFDSYDAIKARVGLALASACTRVLMVIDSPGGDVAGLYETTRQLRAMAQAAKKPLIAYADGIIASAAYAIASAADRIVCPETSFVGSVGVVETMMDHVAADRAFGLNIAVITSGARKADGHPNVPISEGALLEAQKRVDSLAMGFFELVAEMRGVSVDAVRRLEAGLFHGKEAVAAKLADVVATKEQALTMIVSGKSGPANAAAESERKEESKMDWKEQLRKAAADGDEDAKKALAAIEKDEDKAEDKKDEEPKSEEKKDEPKSEEKKDDPKAEGDEPDDKSIAAKAQLVVEQGDTDRRLSALEKESETTKREAILKDATTKKKLTASQLKALRAEKLPTMIRMLALIPDAPVDQTAPLKVTPTIGSTRGGKTSIAAETPLTEGSEGRRPITAADVDERMGLSKKAPAPRWEGRDRVFPMAMDRDSERAAAKALQDSRKGGV